MLHKFEGIIVSTWESNFEEKKNSYVKFLVAKHGSREAELVYKINGIDLSKVPLLQKHTFELDVWATQYEGKTYWQALKIEAKGI